MKLFTTHLKKQLKSKSVRYGSSIFIALLLMVSLGTSAQSWVVYDGSALPADAGFSAGSSNTANGTELMEVVADAENAGNSVLKIVSESADKFYWGSPKFSENFVAGQGFTVIMRAKGISADYDKVTEIELKGGDLREKLRIQTNNIINFEKSDKLDVAFPEGISALDYCIYRVTFEAGKAKVWINEVYMGEGLVSTTSSSDMGWVFGDSNSSSSYGALIDWAIWDETGAYAPGQGAAIPKELVQTELPKTEVEPNWIVYDASSLPLDAGFSAGSSNTANGTELMEVVADADNAGNSVLKIVSESADKYYWGSPKFSENFVAGQGFTVIMRAKGISADYDKVTEIELKGGDLREKLRIQTNNIINFEKSDKLDVAFPEGISALDYCIYRVTFEAGKAKVWINEVYMGEGLVSTTSSSDMGWVFGDSNSSSSYGALIDWAIWDETGAYAPGEGAKIPDELAQPEIKKDEPVAAAWTVYDASVLPADAGFSAGSSNTANGTELMEVVADADNAGNSVLKIVSESADKFYWGSPKFSENFVAGQGFTVIMRAKGISADYDKVTEIELKGGDLREKLRIQTNNIINFEKSDKLDVAFPEGISALDYCIYRVTFEAGKAKVWINEVYMGEGLVSTTSSSDMGWVFGDSNSTSSYGALIDWAIWDETGAYAPGEGADIPADLVKTELEKPITAAAWTVYDASVLPADAGFSEGSSNTANGTELLEIIEDADNSGNQLLSIISGTEDKFYWSSPDFSENFVAGGGFTVVMRAKGISADYDKVTEIEMKGGDLRDKLRIQTNNIINLEKSNKLDLAFPEGISALDFVIYRITYEAGKAKVWINDIYVGEGIVTTEATEDKRWVFGDSNGSSSYGALIDWAIWDETGAYAPGEGAAIPSNLVQIELGEPVDSSMLSVSVETITLSADGGVETVAVSSNVSWTASTTADWISISPTSGENNADITITATANESFSPRQAVVVVTDGANLTSNITVSQEAQVPDGEKLTIVSVVASTEQTGNEAVNTIDGDLSNRWSGEGDGAYIDLKLDRTNTVSFIKIGLYKGSERSSMFDILTSTDGSNFNEALMNITSEITGEPMVIYDIDDVDAKYIRIIGHGNSSSAWNSFTEFEVWGFKLDTPEPVIADVTFIVDDSANKTFTGFALKGSWNTVTGEYDANWSDGAEHTMLYDDGTNGDATAGDHIWSVTLPLVADSGFNTWEWGFNDDAANWIPSANIQFTVVDGTAQTTTYIIEKDETGVDDIRNSVSFYPNPVKNQITLSVNDFTSVTVYSLSGVKLLNSIHKSFDVSNLENGIYLIKVNTSNGSILNAKFLKQ